MSKLFRRTLAAIVLAASLIAVGALAPGRFRDDAPSVAQSSFGQPRDLEAIAVRAERLKDPTLFAELGSAYISRASTTANPELLSAAEEVLERSLALAPEGNPEAAAGMAQLANSRHDFKASVRWARLAISENPYAASPYGLLGDALFELGRVRAADAAYQDMINIRPDLASYIRASYALGYAGRNQRALSALDLAESSVAPASEDAAFVLHQRGDVLYGMKRFTDAEAANRTGMEIAPGYAPPMVGTAESLTAQGRYDEAIALMEEATRLLPSFSYLGTLADLYLVTGDEEAAEKTYVATDAALQALRDHGVLADNDLLLYDARRGRDLARVLADARSIYRDRPTAKTADALGWVMFLNGSPVEAQRLAAEAVRLVPSEALSHFHLAVISEELGQTRSAAKHAQRALALDPAFSLPDLAETERMAKLAR